MLPAGWFHAARDARIAASRLGARARAASVNSAAASRASGEVASCRLTRVTAGCRHGIGVQQVAEGR
jgi:hypothetical protein